jgi:predicted nucleic acid-binding protein
VTEATSPSSGTRSVFDASAVVRTLIGRDPAAQDRFRGEVAWPTHLYVEVAHTLHRLHRNDRISHDRAFAALNALLTFPADVHPVESLLRGAWNTALATGLSVYDACYLVLAEALDAPLVTADRRLAAATPNAVLLA